MKMAHSYESGVIVIDLSGRLDAFAAPEAEVSMLTLAESADAPVVIDLGGLEYVSSSGLQVLVRVAKALEKRGFTLRLCQPTPFVANVLDITHLARYFDVKPTRDEAKAASVR